jgi:YegS/Rv2252/BmrU family lipid kinase
MRKAILLYNPVSGGRRKRRLQDLDAALAVLRAAGVEVWAEATRAAADTPEQTSRAIAEGCDTVFACGGDGTVHDVLQGLAGTYAALGIIPLGTANALAHDLRLPLSPVGAARASLTAKPRRIAVGRVVYRDFSGHSGSRYFTVAAGVGVDAHLFYKLNPRAKNRIGMSAYYLKAARLLLTHKMEAFVVELPEEGAQQTRRAEVTQLLAVRIRDFGGVLRELAPGASLERNDVCLVMCRTRSRVAYLRYVLRGLFATKSKVGGIDLVHRYRVNCYPLDSSADSAPHSRIFVEADGEVLGTLPAEISVVPDAVTLLAPS